MLILTDSRGMPLACSDPIDGNHNDAYELVPIVEKMIMSIQSGRISTDGLFLNVDAGFDTGDFLAYCYQQELIGNIASNPRNGDQEGHLFDELLYQFRFVIERTNARLDAFNVIRVRFETNAIHWKALNLIAFCVILLRQL